MHFSKVWPSECGSQFGPWTLPRRNRTGWLRLHGQNLNRRECCRICAKAEGGSNRGPKRKPSKPRRGPNSKKPAKKNRGKSAGPPPRYKTRFIKEYVNMPYYKQRPDLPRPDVDAEFQKSNPNDPDAPTERISLDDLLGIDNPEELFSKIGMKDVDPSLFGNVNDDAEDADIDFGKFGGDLGGDFGGDFNMGDDSEVEDMGFGEKGYTGGDEEPQDKPRVDFSDDEAETLIKLMRDLDMNEMLDGKMDLLGRYEDENMKAEGIMDNEDFPGYRWKYPSEKLAWYLANAIWPRVGKKKHRQNRDHQNPSPEVKARRRAKQLRGYAIEMSMKVSKIAKHAQGKLKKVPKGSQDAKDIAKQAMDKLQNLLKTKEFKFNLRNITGTIQRVGLIASSGGVENWVINNYPSFLLNLFTILSVRVGELDGRQVADVVWALGKLGGGIFDMEGDIWDLEKTEAREVNVRDMYCNIMEHSMSITDQLNSKDVALFVYGASIIQGIDNRDVVSNMMPVVMAKKEDFNTQDMVNVLWAAVRLDIKGVREYVKEMISHAESRVVKFASEGMSTLVWSLANLGYIDCTELLEKLVVECMYRIDQFKPQEVGNFVWGLCKLRHFPPPKFLASLCERCVIDLDGYPPRQVATVLHACAVWGYEHPAFISKCRSRLMTANEMVNSQDLANSCWSFAMLRVLDDEYFEFCIDRLMDIGAANMHNTEKVQFFQCVIDMQVNSSRSTVLDRMPIEMLGPCKEAWFNAQESAEMDPIVGEVLDLLTQSGVKCNGRVTIVNGLFTVSTAEVANGVKYVVELFPEGGRFNNSPRNVVGKLRWREKILAKNGWFMLRIDELEWLKLRTTEQKQQYLQTMI